MIRDYKKEYNVYRHSSNISLVHSGNLSPANQVNLFYPNTQTNSLESPKVDNIEKRELIHIFSMLPLLDNNMEATILSIPICFSLKVLETVYSITLELNLIKKIICDFYFELDFTLRLFIKW